MKGYTLNRLRLVIVIVVLLTLAPSVAADLSSRPPKEQLEALDALSQACVAGDLGAASCALCALPIYGDFYDSPDMQSEIISLMEGYPGSLAPIERNVWACADVDPVDKAFDRLCCACEEGHLGMALAALCELPGYEYYAEQQALEGEIAMLLEANGAELRAIERAVEASRPETR